MLKCPLWAVASTDRCNTLYLTQWCADRIKNEAHRRTRITRLDEALEPTTNTSGEAIIEIEQAFSVCLFARKFESGRWQTLSGRSLHALFAALVFIHWRVRVGVLK